MDKWSGGLKWRCALLLHTQRTVVEPSETVKQLSKTVHVRCFRHIVVMHSMFVIVRAEDRIFYGHTY